MNFKKFSLALVRGIIPAICLTLPIGSVYAFSLFSSDIATYINCSLSQVQFAFSLSIFFLGMGAAFGGKLVEKNINKAGFTASLLFLFGLLTTTLGINVKNIWLIYLGYGVLNGTAQGIGYLTPVKTVLLWFPRNKGLASAVSIISFGLGSSLCSLLFNMIYPICGITYIFAALSIFYFPMMMFGSCLLKKPKYALRKKDTVKKEKKFSYKMIFKDRFFWQSWLFMLLNISAGLALIGVCKNIFNELKLSNELIITLMMLAGLFNGGFRLIFAWWSDFLEKRINIQLIISLISVAMIVVSAFYFPIIVIAILIINATYGGGFSTIVSILSDKFGNNNLSTIHGLVLSAWGISGLIGNNLSVMMYNISNSYYYIVYLLMAMYVLNTINVLIMKKNY